MFVVIMFERLLEPAGQHDMGFVGEHGRMGYCTVVERGGAPLAASGLISRALFGTLLSSALPGRLDLNRSASC